MHSVNETQPQMLGNMQCEKVPGIILRKSCESTERVKHHQKVTPKTFQHLKLVHFMDIMERWSS